MKTTNLLIVGMSALGLLATMDVASAATHKTAHHKTMAKCAAQPAHVPTGTRAQSKENVSTRSTRFGFVLYKKPGD